MNGEKLRVISERVELLRPRLVKRCVPKLKTIALSSVYPFIICYDRDCRLYLCYLFNGVMATVATSGRRVNKSLLLSLNHLIKGFFGIRGSFGGKVNL